MNIERFTKALSDILSEKYELSITIKAERRSGDREQEIILCSDTSECKV